MNNNESKYRINNGDYLLFKSIKLISDAREIITSWQIPNLPTEWRKMGCDYRVISHYYLRDNLFHNIIIKSLQYITVSLILLTLCRRDRFISMNTRRQFALPREQRSVYSLFIDIHGYIYILSNSISSVLHLAIYSISVWMTRHNLKN